MQPLHRNVNPFAMMLDPQAVIAQIERSERLESLHRRVCRPLDKPLLGGAAEGGEETGEEGGDSASDGGVSDAETVASADAASDD